MNKQIFKNAQNLVAENAASLLTGTGVVGVITTAVLTGRASVKAHEIIAQAERHSYSVVEDAETGEDTVMKGWLYQLDTVDKIKKTWPLFIPPVASGLTTMGAIVFSYRISVSKSAALAAAYGISEKAFSEYKEKVLEQVTPKKADDIRDAVAQQQIKDNPPPSSTTVFIAEGEVLCLDSFSGTYFRSTVEKIRQAENQMNADIGARNVARLGDFYAKIGMEELDIFEPFTWTLNNHCEVDYTTQMTDDGRPCLVVGFVNAPRPLYDDAMREYM